MAQALEGLRVLDLSTGVAGPMAGMLLADFGADVVKVEPPGGDPSRGRPGFAMWNRNKRSVVVDLAEESGRSQLGELIDAADVVIARGYEEELRAAGADPGTATARNPRLVYLAVPPYLDANVPWAGGEESMTLLSARMGVALRQSSFDGGPIHLVYPHILYDQAIWSAATAVSALIERERSGKGQVVTVGGPHGTIIAMALQIDPTQPESRAGIGPGGPSPTYTRYRCADDEWLFVGALTPKFQEGALATLGLTDAVLKDERINGSLDSMLLPVNRGWVKERFAEVFLTRPREEWVAAFRAADVPVGRVLDRNDWLDHPQTKAIGMRVEMDDPDRGHVVMPGNPVRMTKTPATFTPAPRLGEHTGQLGDWAPQGQPAAMNGHDAVAPLTGFRVLDLGMILAGPYAGMLMAELGAEVVKVEPKEGDSWRDRGWIYIRGQRGLGIDLRSEGGKQAFYQLVRTSDVVIDNYRHGVLERLGIDYDHLKEIKPDIITLSITGFGDTGPFSAEPGFDPLLQAMSGMMKAQGGDSEPVFHTIAVNDVSSAALAAYGSCVALYHRVRTGEGQRVGVALAATAGLMQGEELVRVAGRAPAQVGGRDFIGPDALDRFYATSDGWVCIQDRSGGGLARLREAGLLNGDGGDAASADTAPGGPIAKALEGAFSGLTREAAVERLTRAGIPAAPVRMISELPEDPELQSWNLFQEFDKRDGSPTLQVPARYARFSRTQRDGAMRPPGVGEHTVDVLADAGLETPEVEELIELDMVRQGGPMIYRVLPAYR